MKRQISYAEQLKHPLWKAKASCIRERDDFRCVKCGAENVILHVHHTTPMPDMLAWEYPDDMLVTLCGDCHAWATMYERIFIRLTGGFRYWIGATLKEKSEIRRVIALQKLEALVIFEEMIKKDPMKDVVLLFKLKSTLPQETESKPILTNHS